MFGAVPSLFLLWARMSMPESPRYLFFTDPERLRTKSLNGTSEYVASIEEDIDTEVEEPPVLAAYSKLNRYAFRDYMLLLKVSACWFLLDIPYYTQNLLQSDIFTNIGWLPEAYTMTAARETLMIAKGQFTIALFSSVPGYWFTVFTIEYLGRRLIQGLGFFFMTFFMSLVCLLYDKLLNSSIYLFLFLYALLFFFANWGPNATTFVIPSELFPTRYRCRANGIAGAAGKAGAIIGVFGFGKASDYIGLQKALIFLIIICLIGALITITLPETKLL